ncbi:MAG: hypothetical protein GXP17_01550 [Gammaproteobacteria bacterium]|nr:hypothetical protein [Gammaproteobacteria bacterium]
MRHRLSPWCLCIILLTGGMGTGQAQASGNHPEAGACSIEQPWFAFCTHSLHSLEGWYGEHCYTDRQAAQREAEQHAKKFHQGNMRWTGVRKQRTSGSG